MKKVLFWMSVVLGSVLLPGAVSSAGELDVLLDKLVEKEIITPVEADIIKDETKQKVSDEVASGKSYAVPGWVQKMQLKGDLRLRFQKEKRTNTDDARKRGRVRVRLGILTEVAKNVDVGIGIATAGSSNDPRSRNVTFEDTFDTFPVEWDYAYVKWSANKNLDIYGGKMLMKPVLWTPTDFLWDGDITPEGAALHWGDKLTENMNYWVNGGVWILDENSTADAADPFMKYVQGGITFKEGMLDSKLALTFYDFQGIEDIDLGNSATSQGSNNTVRGSNYRSLNPQLEIGLKKPFGGLPFSMDERIAVFAEYVTNLDDAIVKDENNGWAFGMKMGNKDVKEPGQWQLKYTKVKLQRDAFLDLLPDSDRFGGQTGVESHEVALTYALKKNITLGLDYYKSWLLTNSNNVENLFQADLIFKF